MNREFFKVLFGGALVGAAIFFVPFMIIKIFLFVMFFKLAFHLFGGRGTKKHMWAYAEKIRNMSDDEYNNYKSNYRSHCGYHKI